MNRPLPPLSLLSLMLLILASTSCTTIENRRDLYFPQTVWGPYTKMLHHGIPKPTPDQTTIPSDSDDGKAVVTPQQ